MSDNIWQMKDYLHTSLCVFIQTKKDATQGRLESMILFMGKNKDFKSKSFHRKENFIFLNEKNQYDLHQKHLHYLNMN